VGRAQEYETLLRTGEVLEIDPVEGRNKPQKLALKKGHQTVHGLWKPIEIGRYEWAWESYQAEVVAYQLDQLLGLNMVPPTVVRDIGGEKGSIQLWVDGCTLYRDLQDKEPPDQKWRRQQSRMKLFDNLICNPDRGPDNILVDSSWNIILIDHSQCFLSREGLQEKPEELPTRFDRQLLERLKAVSLARLQVHFSRLLMDRQMETIIARRDALLAHVEKLIDEMGEEAVLF
jgi:hypothetical protein